MGTMEIEEAIEEAKNEPLTPEVKPKPVVTAPKARDPNSELGKSMDSTKMRSTLHNLDLEEITRCLGHAIKRHVDFSVEIRSRSDLSLTIMPEFFEEEEK